MLVNPLVKTPASRATCQQQRPRFSDCALHDMTRDKASVQCYPMPPRFAKKRQRQSANANAAQVYGRKRPASVTSEQKIGKTGTQNT
jgi:hypothetical protein